MSINNTADTRYQLGQKVLGKAGSEDMSQLRAMLRKLDLASERMFVAECFGDLFQRTDVSESIRQKTVIVSLISQRCHDYLPYHFDLALGLGLSERDLVALVALCIPFCGWPACIAAFRILDDWLSEKGLVIQPDIPFDTESELYDDIAFHDIGLARCASIYPDPGALIDIVDQFHPELPSYIVRSIFGYTYGRVDIGAAERQLCAVAILTTLQRLPQLKSHIAGALMVGCKVEQVKAVLILLSAYAGWPAVLNGFTVLQEVERHLEDR